MAQFIIRVEFWDIERNTPQEAAEAFNAILRDLETVWVDVVNQQTGKVDSISIEVPTLSDEDRNGD